MASASVSCPRSITDLIPFTSVHVLDDRAIGCGAFGAVYKAVHSEWGCQVAYKKLAVPYIGDRSNADQQLIQSLKYEAEIHRQLRHPNIVSMLGVVFEENNYGIILEFVTYGSWTDFLNTIRHNSGADMSNIPSILKMKLAHEISSGMSYLHCLGIIHCDLKLQNVLIGEHINGKISDFGLSKWKDYSRSYTNAGMTQGTPSHISPEQWLDMDLHLNDKTDVYSFSILLWEMFTEKQAYEGRKATIAAFVTNGGRLSLNHIPSNVAKEVHSLIEACWDQHPDRRPTFKELARILCPFIQGTLTIEMDIKNAKEIVLSIYNRSPDPVKDSVVEDFEHSQKITQVHQTLCEFMRRPDQILSRLFVQRAVTDEEQTTIMCETNIYKWIRCLLKLLREKPCAPYKCFLEALNDTNQHHLHCLFEDKDYEMNVDHKVTLIDNFTFLKDNITLSDSALLDTLLQTDVLDQREVTEIKSKNMDHERTDQLLQYILRTSHEQYQQFLEALNKTNHQHVYNRLKGEETSSIQFEHLNLAESDDGLELTKFRNNAFLLHVILPPPLGAPVCGITILEEEIFVVRGFCGRSQVNVYDSTSFTLSHNIKIPGPRALFAIAACPHYNCLYLSDTKQKMIYRYDHSVKTSDTLKPSVLGLLRRSPDKKITNWSVPGKCFGLSITKCHNILVTLSKTKRIQEYTTNGCLIREIGCSVNAASHAVEMSTGNFVVCDTKSISILDPKEHIIQSYALSDFNIQFSARHLAVDKHDYVLVTDYVKNRVQLFSPMLTYLGDVDIKMTRKNIMGPSTVHFDEVNHRLYIGEELCGRIYVLKVKLISNSIRGCVGAASRRP